jgi:hypothetical protein
MIPHFAVHGRREQNRRAGGERNRGQRMTGEAVREFRDEVARGRCDEQESARSASAMWPGCQLCFSS